VYLAFGLVIPAYLKAPSFFELELVIQAYIQLGNFCSDGSPYQPFYDLMVENSDGSKTPFFSNRLLKSFTNTKVSERTNVSTGVNNNILVYITSVRINNEYL